jgi:hypothetical protein
MKKAARMHLDTAAVPGPSIPSPCEVRRGFPEKDFRALIPRTLARRSTSLYSTHLWRRGPGREGSILHSGSWTGALVSVLVSRCTGAALYLLLASCASLVNAQTPPPGTNPPPKAVNWPKPVEPPKPIESTITAMTNTPLRMVEPGIFEIGTRQAGPAAAQHYFAGDAGPTTRGQWNTSSSRFTARPMKVFW